MALAAGHLRTMLERCQERWPNVRCTFGQIAFWSAHIGRDERPNSDRASESAQAIGERLEVIRMQADLAGFECCFHLACERHRLLALTRLEHGGE